MLLAHIGGRIVKLGVCVPSLVPRPDPPEKEGPGIHHLHMRVIIYAKTDGEGHMTFPILVLYDVTYYN